MQHQPDHPNLSRKETYVVTLERIESLLDGEIDLIAAMSTIACELHAAFDYFHWTGFYRNTGSTLQVGPYQGGHGCLTIPFDKGVCGAAASTQTTQLVDDVDLFAGHIACSSTTRSEIVVPITGEDGQLIAVLDVDSDYPAAFNDTDRFYLEALCSKIGARFSTLSQS